MSTWLRASSARCCASRIGTYELDGRERDPLATIAAFRGGQVRDAQETLDHGFAGVEGS